MQSTSWANEHSAALREYLAKGMSFSEAVDAINAKFKTSYSRSAAIGRARRLGVAGPRRAKDLPKHCPAPKAPQPQPRKVREHHAPEFIRPMPTFKPTKPVVSRSIRAIFRSQIWSLTIAVTPMAGRRRAKPSLFADTRGAQAQAIALRIFI